MFKIKEISIKSNVSIRMLRYYDEIGLLKPSSKTRSGYRLYDDGDLEVLFKILFYKELDFSLSEIKEMMKKSSPDVNDTLTKHKSLLLKKVERLNKMISTIDDINNREGGLVNMSKLMDMGEIRTMKKMYEKEVKEKYQSTSAYEESIKKTKNYSEEHWHQIMSESEQILKEFYNNMNRDVSDKLVQALVVQWQNHITKYYYNCTNEILAGLGHMYISDERFKNNMDKHGLGTAEFMSRAIEYYSQMMS